MRYFFLLVFIFVPIIEIALFIQVGSMIGLWPTLATVVLTAVVGTWLLRYQGFVVLSQGQEAIRQSEFPLEQVVHGIFLLIAGLLLLTPGFFTDAIGFVFLIPRLRLVIAHSIWNALKKHVHTIEPAGQTGRAHQPGGPAGSGSLIEGEVIHEDPPDPGTGPSDPNSPWTKP